jgi:hypothetical protein
MKVEVDPMSPRPAPRDIRLHTRTLDGLRETRTFTTLAGARRYFARRIGALHDVGSTYAVSADGMVTLYIYRGVTWTELLGYDPDPESSERERERGEDDGREYGHPDDARWDRL